MEPRKEERRSVVASGKTVEEAIANGLMMLGVRRDQVEIEIITEGSRGVLGFGAENARVRLLIKPPPAPAPRPPAPTVTPSPVPEEEGVSPPAPAMDNLTPEQVGRQVLSDLLRLMGIQARVEASLNRELAEEDQPPPVVLNITGGDLGILIGRRGETLQALQYLVRLMVSHRLKHWTDLVVDVENYRVRRRRALQSLAERVAEQVAQTGRIQALEPMPPSERRIVHITLRQDPRVTTQSVGEGEKRKVTIIPRR